VRRNLDNACFSIVKLFSGQEVVFEVPFQSLAVVPTSGTSPRIDQLFLNCPSYKSWSIFGRLTGCIVSSLLVDSMASLKLSAAGTGE
jgi:hypothetical protein